MKTKKLQKSFSRLHAISFFTLLMVLGSTMINSASAQAFTHIWKGGSANWGTTNWYAVHTTQVANASSGSTSVTLSTQNASIAQGDYVAGYGIVPGTTVQTYPGTGTSLTLSQNTTAAISLATLAFYKSSSDKGSAPTSTSLVLINSGTCTIQSGTAAVGRIFMGNTTATDQGELVISTGGSLTTSAAANNNNSNASLVFFGGKITMSGGTLNANATGYTTVSYPVRFENPNIAPSVSWGIFGTGTFNINHQDTAGTTGGAVIFNNTNTPSNAPEIDLNNATYTNAATGSTGFIGFTVSAGCNGIIGGTGLTIGTSGTPTVNNSALILLNQGSLTVNSGTTLNFYCASSTKNCISVQPASGTTTFTNNGIISIGGTLAKGVYLNYGAANTGTINFTNAGNITVNATVTGTYSGALFMGGSASNTASINVNNSGTMSITNTQTAGTGLGYALYCANSTSVTTNTITNSGTLTFDGTLTSTGGVGGKTTINNTGTVTLNTTGLDITAFNNNSGGVLDCKTYTLASNSNYVVTLKAGSTLKTANTGGLACISGTLPNGAVLESGANYVFNGGSTQTTGSTGTAGAALTANNIEISNSNGVTLSNATTVNGKLTLTSGILTTTPGLTLGNGASIDKSSGSISAAPNTYGTSVNLTYNGTATKGNEFPGTDIINTLTVNNTGGITLTDNRNIPNLTIANGSSLSVGAGNQLTVSTSMTNNGTLNLLSTSGGTATILTPATISGSGTASVNQYLSQDATSARNWYISSPVSGASAVTPSGYTFYQYVEPGNNADLSVINSSAYWQGLVTGTAYTSGRGYIALPTSNGSTTFTFNGSLHSTGNNISVALTKLGTLKTGFNLIGNPYPAHYTITKAQTDAANALNTIWYRTATWVVDNVTPSNSKYVYTFQTCLINGDGSIQGTPSGTTNIIPPMQAFWVRTTIDGSTFNFNGTLSHQASNPMKVPSKKEVSQPIARFHVSNGIVSDEALIYFNTNASNDFDSYDALKMNNNSPSVPEIYTLADNQQITINGMNAIPYDSEIPLGFTTGKAGSFSITASQFSNFDTGTQIILNDNQTNTQWNLTDGSAYNFNSDITNSNTNRFSLVFKAPSISTGNINNDSESNSVLVYLNVNNLITINCKNGIFGQATVCVYNSLGQKLEEKTLTSSISVFEKLFPAGVYVVSVSANGKRTTQKITIN